MASSFSLDTPTGLRHRTSKPLGQSLQGLEAGVLDASFKSADIVRGKARLLGEVDLRQAFLQPNLADIEPEFDQVGVLLHRRAL